MTIEEQNRMKLREAVIGLDVTPDEQHTLDWLASMEMYSVDNIVSLIIKAKNTQKCEGDIILDPIK